jgi:molybdate transport system ATP-binding protein
LKATDHWAVFLSNNANKQLFILELLNNKASGKFSEFNNYKGVLFSDLLINEIMEEEYRHDCVEVATEANRSLRFLSGGERRKALLNYCLSQKPDYIILDNPFDNLDTASQKSLRILLREVANHTSVIQLIHRRSDVLDFIGNAISINDNNTIIHHSSTKAYLDQNNTGISFNGNIPPAIHTFTLENNTLVDFHSVSVSYDNKPILKDICWQINAGEFWQLIGPNGSGKTTLLSMIIGDNPQGYGQELFLFGRKKGSGESVWEIKDKIGYFTSSMTDLFSKYYTLEHMIIGGFMDSIGLYIQPSDHQLKLAEEWLSLIGMNDLKHTLFVNLSLGQQRMALIARAMVKHPPLLILDEPASGLDDANTLLVTALINKIAAESKTTILYVSHRKEEGLEPKLIFELIPTEDGSIGNHSLSKAKN